jgi:DNA-binding transcriptional LysR family regulator
MLSIARLRDFNKASADIADLWLPNTRVLGDLNNYTSDFRAAEGNFLLSSDAGESQAIEHEMVDLDRIITREHYHLIMAASHRLASKPAVMLADLDGEDLIDRSRCSGCQRLRELCAATGVMPRFRHRVDSFEQLVNLAHAGFGIGFTARSDRLVDGVVGRPIERVEIDREVSLATVAGRPFSAATDAFVKLARSRDWAVNRCRAKRTPAPAIKIDDQRPAFEKLGQQRKAAIEVRKREFGKDVARFEGALGRRCLCQARHEFVIETAHRRAKFLPQRGHHLG